jgi:hypothetical protein
MGIMRVAAFVAERALATPEFPGYVALAGQLPRTGLTVSEAACRHSWRVFRIGNLLCWIDRPESARSGCKIIEEVML